MKTNADMSVVSDVEDISSSAAPSADFIHAISEFLDTDPGDLLVEMGYYTRAESESNISFA